jgi:hypothetical protein
MPSNIRPKDFENHLPKETDTVAQGLVKYVQFAILFWRWFRSEFKSDGTFGHNVKYEMCKSGCLEKEIVNPGNNNEEDIEGEDDEDVLPGPIAPEPTNPDAGQGGCCKKVENYGVPENDFEFLTLNERSPDGTTSNVDILCDGNNHKFVGFTNKREQALTLTSNENWRKATDRYFFHQGYSEGGQKHFDVGNGNYSGDAKVAIKTNTWTQVEVVLYGKMDELEIPNGVSDDAQVTGYFQINPTADGRKFNVKLGNGGDWCVRIIIHTWEAVRTEHTGLMTRDFKFRIQTKVDPQYITGKNKNVYWKKRADKPYFLKFYGMRMVHLGYGQAFLATSQTGNPVLVGVENHLRPDFVLYDERWQNDGAEPCFKPSSSWLRGKSQAWTFTYDGHLSGYAQIYPHSTVNNLKITYDSINGFPN